MKPTTRAALVGLGINLCLLLPHTGQCFYNPSTGRWLSRDPINDPGSSVLTPSHFSIKSRDGEFDSIYYGYRYYSPSTGKWLTGNPVPGRVDAHGNPPARALRSGDRNCFGFVANDPVLGYDPLGLWHRRDHGDNSRYGGEDEGWTCSFNPFSIWRHFRDLEPTLSDLNTDIRKCDGRAFLSHMHQMEDYFAHYKQGFRWYTLGHCWCGTTPDDPEKRPDDFREMQKYTALYEVAWEQKCGSLPRHL